MCDHSSYMQQHLQFSKYAKIYIYTYTSAGPASTEGGNCTQNVKSCYEPVKFKCHIGNVLAAVVSSMNIFGTE